jgi:hypothetical protein
MNFAESYEIVSMTDPEIGNAMKLELGRQRDHIELIASENFVSKAVLAAMGSPLTNKYAEGYRVNAITAVANTLTWSKQSPLSARRNSFTRTMQTFSRTRARRQIWRHIRR